MIVRTLWFLFAITLLITPYLGSMQFPLCTVADIVLLACGSQKNEEMKSQVVLCKTISSTSSDH